MQELVTLCMSDIGRLLGTLGLLPLGVTLILWGLKRRRSGAISSWRRHCLHPQWIWGLVSLLLVILLWIPKLVTAEDLVEVLTLRYEAEGRYALAAGGVGMTNSPSGDIPLDVPGTVIRTYLYWGGWDEIGDGGDNTVSLSVDGGVAIPLTADETHGPAFWFGNYERYIYVEDVTSLVQAGAHIYTVSGFDASMYYRDGAGLMVVYEDSSLSWTRVEIKDGLDRFYRGWGEGPRGETAITCFTFEAFPADREMDIMIFVGGVAIDGPDRPNALWYRTGTDADTMPTDMIFEEFGGDDDHDPDAEELQGPPNYPFRSLDGKEWDTYTNWIPIPAGHTWACIQIESADYLDYTPSSGVGMTFGASFEGPTPTATPTPTPSTGTPTPTETSTGTPTPTPPTGTPTPTPSTETPTPPTPTATPTPPTPTGTPTPTETSNGTPTPPTPTGTPTPPTPTGTPTPTATPTPTEVLTVERLPETGGFPGWFTVVLGVPLVIGAAGLLHLALLEMRGRRGGGKGD